MIGDSYSSPKQIQLHSLSFFHCLLIFADGFKEFTGDSLNNFNLLIH
jgi:hypothetical protein